MLANWSLVFVSAAMGFYFYLTFSIRKIWYNSAFLCSFSEYPFLDLDSSASCVCLALNHLIFCIISSVISEHSLVSVWSVHLGLRMLRWVVFLFVSWINLLYCELVIGIVSSFTVLPVSSFTFFRTFVHLCEDVDIATNYLLCGFLVFHDLSVCSLGSSCL